MTDSPRYKLHKTPRFSANSLSQYLATDTAAQRRRIIQRAKYPLKNPIIANKFPNDQIRLFFANGNRDVAYFDSALAHLQSIAKTDPIKKDTVLREIEVIEAFKKAYSKRRWKKKVFVTPLQQNKISPGGVPVNVMLHTQLEEIGEDTNGARGGLIVFTSKSSQARRLIEKRRLWLTQLILWSLEGKGNLPVEPRLCMVMDVFGDKYPLTKASDISSRFRSDLEESMTEVKQMWPVVEPPDDYDGPPWQ